MVTCEFCLAVAATKTTQSLYIWQLSLSVGASPNTSSPARFKVHRDLPHTNKNHFQDACPQNHLNRPPCLPARCRWSKSNFLKPGNQSLTMHRSSSESSDLNFMTTTRVVHCHMLASCTSQSSPVSLVCLVFSGCYHSRVVLLTVSLRNPHPEADCAD